MTLRPTLRLPFLGFLLCLSGACALVYQTAWLRDLRLVFGGATPAAAAVLAIFMGGLGAGSALLGRRSETVHDPLRLYGLIEIGVGASALLTPFLLAAVRALYVRTGGITALGLGPATLLQLGLSAVVLAAPCVLMGGSLPAAFKWAEAVRAERDAQRGDLGVLYGLNTLGAVAGVMASTFWLLEAWGIRATVWAAAAVNLAVGAAAVWVARGRGNDPDPRRQARPVSGGAQAAGASHRTGRPSAGPLAPDAVGQRVAPRFVFLAAAITGFAFFLMELVWFRMLAPLVGSSLYGFGLILAVALAGIGAGGLLYRWWWAPYPGAVSPRSLARVSAWQALLLAVPWALGDSIAVFAYHVNGLRALGLAGQITGWALVTGLLVLGPSLLAGVQFPLLVGLLGEGARDAGRDVGHAYAANTLGAVAGALAGGFILVPGLAATGSWRLVVGLTLGLSLGAAVLAIRAASRLDLAATAGLWVCAAFLVLALPGPTAAWRHVPIGYGRIGALPTTVNGLREWQTERRSDVLREIEGREASVAVAIGGSGHALLVGGKSDGTAFGDADTQVMLGLLPAMLHPEPRTAFVVGLGTGTTAGWLADVPGMQRVDVAEIEPGIAALAREFFAPVNRGALDKPNVRLIAGDARELLVTRGPVYDLIVSEPSNPYRAGVATLYTEEYYAAVKGRLAPGGLFGQWLQGYEVDSRAVRLVYATLASVFPFVETWVTEMGDLLFICHLAPPAYPMDQLRTRIAQPPYAEAIRRVWLTDSVEGVLARHLATPDVARRIAAINGERNTDDRNRLEYGFARALSQASAFDAGQVLSMALAANADVPAHLVGQVDARRIQLERLLMLAADDTGFVVPPELVGDDRRRAEAVLAFVDRRYADVVRLWPGEPNGPMAALVLLESAARTAAPEDVRPRIGPLVDDWPADARFAAAETAARNGAPDTAVEHLVEGFAALRGQVWSREASAESALALAVRLAAGQPDHARALLEPLREPFPGGLAEPARRDALAAIGPHLPPELQLEVATRFDPYPAWNRTFLEFRRDALSRAGDPRADAAARDVEAFIRHADPALQETRPTRP